MAGNLPVPLGVECKLIWGWQGNPYAINVLHFRNTPGTAVDQTRANSIDSLIKAQMGTTNLNTLLHTGVSLISVHTRDMRDNTNLEFVGAGAATPGTGTGDPLPAAVSYVATLKTASRGRSFQGRLYTWGFTEASNDALGGITSASSVIVVNWWSGVMSAMASVQNLNLCVLSRFTTPPGTQVAVERNPPILTSVVSVIARDLRWDTQRRRAVPGI